MRTAHARLVPLAPRGSCPTWFFFATPCPLLALRSRVRPLRAQDSIVTSVLALPTQKWSAVRDPKNADGEECAMCMETFAEEEEVRVLKCAHYFHTKCIDEWLVVGQRSKSRSCPLCQHSPI